MADILVALGVGVEIKFGQMAGLRQNELKKRSDEKVSESNERAANAELEAQKLKAQFSWRYFDKETASTLLTSLESKPAGAINILFVSADPDSQSVAGQLTGIFKTAQWSVAGAARMWADGAVFGIAISERLSVSRDSLLASFADAKIGFFHATMPAVMTQVPALSSDKHLIEAAELYVGPKNPTFQKIPSAANEGVKYITPKH